MRILKSVSRCDTGSEISGKVNFSLQGAPYEMEYKSTFLCFDDTRRVRVIYTLLTGEYGTRIFRRKSK